MHIYGVYDNPRNEDALCKWNKEMIFRDVINVSRETFCS